MLFNKITALGGVVALCLLVGCSVTGDVPTDACEEGPSAPGTTNAPTGDLRGWTQVFVDNFDRCELGEMWGAYSGQPGGDPHSWWEPEQVSVTEGVLRLRAQQDGDQWVTGGVSNSAVSQTYGKWMVRLRAGVSDEISYHVLLWPRDEVGRQRSTSRKVCRVDVSRCHLLFIGPTKVSITSHKRTQLVDSTNGIPSVWSGARELFDTLSTIVSGLNSNHLLFHRLPCGWGFRRKPGHVTSRGSGERGIARFRGRRQSLTSISIGSASTRPISRLWQLSSLREVLISN